MSFVAISKSNSAIYYSILLERYRQTGDICTFLDIRFSDDENNLPEKFAAFDTADFRLSNNSFLEQLVPSSILRQFTVARCSYEEQLSYLINSSNSEESNDFVDERTPDIIVPASVSMLAVLFNFSLLVVTARKISMSTMCNWLIAFDSFCQIPALLPFLVNLFAVCARLGSVDYRVCLISLMLSTGFSYAAFLAIFFMSMERLLIVAMPMRMSQISEKTIKYCSLLAVLACLCFGVAMILMIFNVLTDIYVPFGRILYCKYSFYTIALSVYYVSHAILGLALLNYVLIAGLIVWRRIYVPSTQPDSNNNAAYSQATRRMLRSVFLISIVLAIGWLTGSVLLKDTTEPFIGTLITKFSLALFGVTDNDLLADYRRPEEVKALNFSANLHYSVMGLANCLFPVAAGINAPVLIINNSDYREAYKKTLAPLLICRRNRISPAAVGPLFSDHHQHQHQ